MILPLIIFNIIKYFPHLNITLSFSLFHRIKDLNPNVQLVGAGFWPSTPLDYFSETNAKKVGIIINYSKEFICLQNKI